MNKNVTELFCFVDDFCKAINKNFAEKLLPKSKKPTRTTEITHSEILTIILLYQQSRCENFKSFYTYYLKALYGSESLSTNKKRCSICNLNKRLEVRKKYLTDLSEREWELIEKYLRVSYKKGGRPLKHSKREVLNAILYVLRTGCQWRYLPHDFPPWKAVHEQFRRWKKQGVFEKMNYDITKYSRSKMGRNEEPSACIIDSQSVKTTEKGGQKATMEQRKLKVERGI